MFALQEKDFTCNAFLTQSNKVEVFGLQPAGKVVPMPACKCQKIVCQHGSTAPFAKGIRDPWLVDESPKNRHPEKWLTKPTIPLKTTKQQALGHCQVKIPRKLLFDSYCDVERCGKMFGLSQLCNCPTGRDWVLVCFHQDTGALPFICLTVGKKFSGFGQRVVLMMFFECPRFEVLFGFHW